MRGRIPLFASRISRRRSSSSFLPRSVISPHSFLSLRGHYSPSSQSSTNCVLYETHTLTCYAHYTVQTIQLLIRETLSTRKNTSPQTIYEVNQLYACGALKVACVGLQCIGFNRQLYEKLQELGESASRVGSGELGGQGTNTSAGESGLAGRSSKSPGMAGSSVRSYAGQGDGAYSPNPARSPARSPHLGLNLNFSPGPGLSINTPTRRGAGAGGGAGGPPSPLNLQFHHVTPNPTSSPVSTQIPMGPWNSMSGVHVGMGSPGGVGRGRGAMNSIGPMGGMSGMHIGPGTGAGMHAGAGMEGNENVPPGAAGV